MIEEHNITDFARPVNALESAKSMISFFLP